MKIIKENRNWENVFPMRITCKRVVDVNGFAYGDEYDFCGSELEINGADISKHPWAKYPDYSGVDYGVICPVCGKFIVVDEKKLPASIKLNSPEVKLNA